MNLKQKVAYTANHIDSIARHADVEVDERLAALDRVIKYATDAKATAEACPYMPPKVAIATDEKAIRERIASVQALMKGETDKDKLAALVELERTFGAMLPPVSGTLVIKPADVTLEGK